jgi:predicted nucleic acid-binding protein
MTSPMPVVSNTSPILGLAAIAHLDLLRRQFERILIPQAVLAELKVDTNLRGAKVIHKALKQGWLEPRAVQNVNLARALALELDGGESEAIALALETNAPFILLDEHDGRVKAHAMGLNPVGVLGILLRAKKEKDIPSLKQALQSLRDEAGFFIGDELYHRVLFQAKEDK